MQFDNLIFCFMIFKIVAKIGFDKYINRHLWDKIMIIVKSHLKNRTFLLSIHQRQIPSTVNLPRTACVSRCLQTYDIVYGSLDSVDDLFGVLEDLDSFHSFSIVVASANWRCKSGYCRICDNRSSSHKVEGYSSRI